MRPDTADGLRGGGQFETVTMPRDHWPRQIVGEEITDGNRPGSRSAGAVRPGEGLVHVVVHHVAAEIPWPRDAHDRVHVRAVDIDQAASGVDDLCDFGDSVLE